MMQESGGIVVLGYGNVGTHLVERFIEKKQPLWQIYNRTPLSNNSYLLENQVVITNDLKQINRHAKIYLLSVRDDAIALVAEKLAPLLPSTAIIAHTSGGTPSAVFQPFFQNYGVFYPLQTFSVGKKANFETLPLCIDGSNQAVVQILETLAKTICPNVHRISDSERAILHVAAVFANNFTNHLWAISEEILRKEGLDFDLLKPLIRETLNKIEHQSPVLMQTGPARRGDVLTIQRHEDFLKNQIENLKIYKTLSEKIKNSYQKT